MERENVQIDMRSREFRDLLATLPRWPVWWGMLVTLCVLLILFLIDRRLESPERITTRITFTEQNVVATEPCRITGQILLPAIVGKKVVENQRVIVKVDGFTSGGSGKREGIVSKVTRMDSTGEDGGYYAIEVLLIDNIKSGHALSPSGAGCWEADIITGNRSFLRSVFGSLSSL